MIRELIDSELETVAGGLLDLNLVAQSIDAPSDCYGERERHRLLRCWCWWRGYRC